MDIIFRTLQGGRRTAVTVGGMLCGVAIRGRKDSPNLLLGIAVAIFKARPHGFDSYTNQLIDDERPPVHRATLSETGIGFLIQLWHQYHMELMAQNRAADEGVHRLLTATARLAKLKQNGDCVCEACLAQARDETSDAMEILNAPKPGMTLSEKYARRWLRITPIIALDGQADVSFWMDRMALMRGEPDPVHGVRGIAMAATKAPGMLILDDPLTATGIAEGKQPDTPLTVAEVSGYEGIINLAAEA